MTAPKPASLLVIEDNPTQQMVIRTLAENYGFTTFLVSSGEEALIALQTCEDCYDAILMDVKLSDMDGIECTKRIRALESQNSRIPIIAVTALAMPGDKEKCLSGGMDDYLSKPFTADDFRKILLRWTYNADRPNLRLLPKSRRNTDDRKI